ncbi:uncharacterized protein LOC131025566 [Salvia miltiorrhiza]|uniref:uncharacterized protein LOC131025566 n=1 Tax=Salvia miltiorrhiza TaxID=226208 RepID=UPI0025AB6FDC|nr:uncharacterized protein LOC131025566 [Salvia miltiorrhiza]
MEPFIVGPFLMIGDFNSILGAHERCDEFRAFIEDHDLIQPESTGPFFTWTNQRRFPSPIKSVLDRALLSQNFSDIWYSSAVLVFSRLGSDHSPIMLRCQDTASAPAGRRFRFLNMWCSHEGFLDHVRASWSSPLDSLCPMVRVMKKLKRLRPILKAWNMDTFGNYNTALAELQQDLSSLQEGIDEQGYTDDLFDQKVILQARIGTVLLRKSEHLQQQSWRRSNQTIKKLSIDGVISEDPATMAAHVIHFYEDLFSEPDSGVVDRSWISGYIPSSHSWEVVEEDMVAAVRRFFSNGYLHHGLNSNLLYLLPKKVDTVLVSDYRPIVLGNFFFKVITKIMASRLNAVVAEIVLANQFGFISGCSIQECILLASECVNCMERSIQGRNMALKVDIRKAFDTLSWEFVDVVLDSFGFPPIFRQWIRVIFQSARISVLFNGEQHGFFSCFRGVRSHFLFGLAEDVLSHLLLDAADRGLIARMWMSRSMLFYSYLRYADDVILFCKAERRSCRMIESILQIYASVSGQFCNKAKSTIYFGKGVPLQLRRSLQHDLGFSTGSLPFVYLGVPIFAGRASSARLTCIRDRIIAHFPRWQGIQLSMAGCICLVISVIQSAAVYSMLIYKWPAKLLHDLDHACRSFIWTGSTTTKPKTSVAWNRVCAPKNQGGLNVKSFSHISQSFMLRLGWLLITSDSMGFQLFRQCYLDSCLRPRSPWFTSTIWLGTRESIRSLVSDTYCSIGSSSAILLWMDSWLGYRLIDMIGIPTAVHQFLMQPISGYYFDDSWHFTLDFLHAFLDIAFDIVSVPISGGEDRWAWIHSYFGEVSSSLAMHHVHPSFPAMDWGKWIWAPFIPVRRSIVTWRVILGRLSTASSMSRSGYIGSGWCPLCRKAGEDIDYLFWECAIARHVWSSLFTWFRVDGSSIYNIGSLIIWAMKVPASKAVFDEAPVFAVALTIQVKAFILEASRFSLGEMANLVEELLILHGLKVPGRPRRLTSYIYVFWLLSSPPWRKINIDGSVHGSPPLIHAGGVIRDSSSVVGCFYFSAGRGWAFEAELLALIIALEQIVMNGWDYVWIETDCTYMVDLFRFRSSTVPWREGNRVADFMASSMANEGFWPFAIPDILQLFIFPVSLVCVRLGGWLGPSCSTVLEMSKKSKVLVFSVFVLGAAGFCLTWFGGALVWGWLRLLVVPVLVLCRSSVGGFPFWVECFAVAPYKFPHAMLFALHALNKNHIARLRLVDRRENCVLGRKKDFARAYYHNDKPEFIKMCLLFGLDNLKTEKSHSRDVILISDSPIVKHDNPSDKDDSSSSNDEITSLMILANKKLARCLFVDENAPRDSESKDSTTFTIWKWPSIEKRLNFPGRNAFAQNPSAIGMDPPRVNPPHVDPSRVARGAVSASELTTTSRPARVHRLGPRGSRPQEAQVVFALY